MQSILYRYFITVILLIQAGLQPLAKALPVAAPSGDSPSSITSNVMNFGINPQANPARRHRPTATARPTATSTSTRTALPTNTLQPAASSTAVPTRTAVPTSTSVPPSLMPTNTSTALPPTATKTSTAVPPTSTPQPPTTTRTSTSLPPTSMPQPPTATRTNTSVPPTATKTNTAVPPTSTPQPPTATPNNTLLATFTATATQKSSPVHTMTGIKVMRVDYKNYATSRSEVAQWEQLMQSAGINMVALGAGRVEWAYFKWGGHEANWSNDVKDTGIDFLAQDAARFGQWADINAVIDVLSPNYILSHPGAAAINALGQPSSDLVSTSELVNGNYGQMLLDMVDYIAANYSVDSISITELSYHVDGYGPDDLALYTAATGRVDWPRNSDGSIDINDPSIGNWRSSVLGDFLGRATALAHSHGKQLYFDVGVDINNLNDAENNHGTNYGVMLQHVDRLVVWAYFGDYGYSPGKTKDLAQYLSQYGLDRIILSIGLWGPSGSTVSVADFQTAVQASQDGGMPNIWICPGSLMTSGHWQVLDTLWKPQ